MSSTGAPQRARLLASFGRSRASDRKSGGPSCPSTGPVDSLSIVNMFSAEDRILVFAPHPDDESLAAGGFLQRAFQAGTPTRIVYATSGDNNPWAQRLFERRWRIGLADRKRWGERRKQEALAALRVLGGSEEQAIFWDLPDQGINSLLMRAIRPAFELLREQVLEWKPTLVLQPAAEDAHPDHSALHVLLSLACASLPEPPPTTLNYVVHRAQAPLPEPAHTLRLAPDEVKTKLAAILAHESQVAASQRRFTAYAQPDECFYDELSDFLLQPPVRNVSIQNGELSIEIAMEALAGDRLDLLLVMQTEGLESMRWSLAVPRLRGPAFLCDEVTGSLLHEVQVTRNARSLFLRLPDLPPLQRAFVKPQSRTLFFDRAGWIRVPRFTVDTPHRSRLPRPAIKRHVISSLS
jgi:LmbE family N-acetylglucosaminyl deacetylase